MRIFYFIATFYDENFDPSDLKRILYMLQNPAYDISSCLANCSNHGVCKLANSGGYKCYCNENFNGSSCQFDLRGCSHDYCLNNSTCTQLNNSNKYDCLCQYGYSGKHCEKKIDLCHIVSCFNGYCVDKKSKTSCICLKYFSGEKCQLQNYEIVIIKTVTSTMSIIATIILICIYLIAIINDFSNLFIQKLKI